MKKKTDWKRGPFTEKGKGGCQSGFILKAGKAQLTLVKREFITSGSANVYPVRFEFSDDWDGLTRTAVFRAGDESRSVLLDNSNEAVIPWEVLREPNLQLFCGVYGTRNGGAVLPTIWADMGAIFRGAELSEEEAQPPTPDIWEQKLDAKADGFDYDGLNLSLMSGDRTLSTVQIAGGESGGAVPGKGGFFLTVETEPAEEGTVVTITDANGPHSFTVRDGKDGGPGPAGPEGQRGETGPQGEPGNGVPEGGAKGQILVKQSGGSHNTAWEDNAADKIKFGRGETKIQSDNVQGAIQELFTSVSNGKKLIASAITDKEIPTAQDADFETMAENIRAIESGGLPEDVCSIRLKAEPEEYGTASGSGIASKGMTVSVQADSTGGLFARWEENGKWASDENPYTFQVERDRSLTAKFEKARYLAGRDWFAATLPASGTWQDAAYGDGTFVAVGRSVAAYSTDGGKTWKSSSGATSAQFKSVAYGGGVFAAVSESGGVGSRSTDGGKTWTSFSLPGSGGWYNITYGDGRFVAVAYNTSMAAYSTDGGETWTKAALPKSTGWQGLAYGEGTFVTTSSSLAAYSTDGGETWTEAAIPSASHWYSAAYGKGRFIAVATGTIIACSADGGKTWESKTPTGKSTGWESIAYGDGIFVTTVNGNNKAAYSADGGETWAEVTTPISNGLRGVTYGDGRFVAVRQGGTDAAYSFTGNDTPAGIQRIGESVLAENSHFELEGIPSAATYSGDFI